MIRRMLLVAAAAGAVAGLTPAAHANECPPGMHKEWTGLYSPTTGEPWEICIIYIPPPA